MNRVRRTVEDLSLSLHYLKTSARFSVRFFTVIFGASLFMMIILSILDYNTERIIQELKQRYEQVEKSRDQLIEAISREHEDRNREYVAHMRQINFFLKKQMEETMNLEQSKAYLARLGFITVLIFFLLSWLIILRLLRQGQDALVESYRQLKERTVELKELTEILDHKVQQRTRLFEFSRQQNEQLQIANRKLKTLYEIQKKFSSTLSHELRTPMASIKTAIDIVLSGTAGTSTAEQKNFLGMAKDNIDRLNRLINDILDLAHMESDKMLLDLQIKDINQIIQSVVEMQQNVVNRKGLYLKAQLDPTIPSIALDADRLTQVLNNLINNAIKFTETGGITVESHCFAGANHIKVCVRDTGCGIESEDISKLFQRFQQLGEPAHRKVGGTGLGLAICKEIIRLHGGKIEVESQWGKGSCFYFLLPLEERRMGQHERP